MYSVYSTSGSRDTEEVGILAQLEILDNIEIVFCFSFDNPAK